MYHILKRLSLALMLAWPVVGHAAGLLVDAELSATHDSNVSRAASSADIKSDNILTAGVTARQAYMLSPFSGVLLRGGVQLAEFAHYDELSQFAVNGSVMYRFQPVVGYSTPVFDVEATLERLMFRDSDIRDGTTLQTSISASSRITDRIRLRGGAGLERRWADDGDVYQWLRDKLFVAVDYRLTDRATVYLNLARVDGDQVFTSSPALTFLNAAKAVADDPVFGARRAYRLGARADQLEVGLSIPLAADQTLDIGASYSDIDAESGKRYQDSQLRASWLYRFR